VVGKRRDFKSSALLPHNVPFTLLGAGLLWFGWFGFNAGSALAANASAALAFTTTMLAPTGTLVVWTLLDYARNGKPTAVGAATAIVVGLVAITPAAGFVGPMSAIALGAVAAFPSYFGLLWRARTTLDDSLDVVAAHGLGGTVGALLTGVFAQKALNGATDGLLFGNPAQLGIQAVAVAAALAYSGIMSFILLKGIALVMPLRADAESESVGMDVTEHGEEAYVHGGGSQAALV
jgi:Amt family ammonium transporter